MSHFPNIYSIHILYQENGAQFIKAFISQRSLSNGFIYVVDAHFIDKIEEKTILDPCVRELLATDRWFSPDPPVSFTNKTDHYDIAEIFLKVALNAITQTINQYVPFEVFIIDCNLLNYAVYVTPFLIGQCQISAGINYVIGWCNA